MNFKRLQWENDTFTIDLIECIQGLRAIYEEKYKTLMKELWPITVVCRCIFKTILLRSYAYHPSYPYSTLVPSNPPTLGRGNGAQISLD